ncbi:glycogen debranching protein GlgX [Phenylobacterium sp. LjRoot219]|uniref:glycogen debranching protein GlgX n=1 Tax=Phenylobacterium sp. LjRoot219 TaxID=3342283 RepID=UPI003ECC9AD4
MARGRVTAGRPEPLGVTLTPSGVNVAVASSTAQAIDLCLFDAKGAEQRIRLPERTGEVFHGHVEGVAAGDRYGLRAHGLYAPERGLRFDAEKLLVDPYAVALDAPFALHASLFTSPPDSVDTAAFVPKAIVTASAPPADAPMVVPWEQTVIYEAHVRGLTRLHPEVPEAQRGTFAALAHPAVIAHLKGLGVTTLELLPTAAWVDERHLPPLGLSNYWGYNPIAFCAPDPRLAPGGWPEVRAATKALAAAGIEVILDVVFNHSGEGDELGPTLSLRGLDNAGSYWLDPADPARYLDHAGTGNALRLDRPQGVRLAMEAMRAWVQRGGVAGFRFDLAPVLGRRANGFDPHAPLLAAIDQDPLLRGLKLIAEPWDCGLGGYQLGRFPAAWGEWNDGFRDTVRRFWAGAGASLGELAGRLAGSQERFGARHRPSRSVNFVTAHDGFTLADLVSYAAKHNDANGEHNRDGTDQNCSWNHGVEGPCDDPAVHAARRADQRALLATLILARGTPMLAMGAELGHSQGGNNNAYAQDNAIGWIDWAQADRELAGFAARLTQARREHPALSADRFLTGEATDSPYPDVEWRRADGAPLAAGDWDDPHGPALQMALASPLPDGGLDRVALLLNRGGEALAASLPEPRDSCGWRVLADSADPTRDETLDGRALALPPRAVVLLAEIPVRRKARLADDDEVRRLAAAAGITPEWHTIDGQHHAVSVETQRALLTAMALPTRSPDEVHDSLWRLAAPARVPLPPLTMAAAGQPTVVHLSAPDGWLIVEDAHGQATPVPVVDGEARLPPLAAGRYALQAGGERGELIVAPPRAFEPAGLAQGQRIFGLSAQLYTLRRDGDQGIGDFTALAQLGDLAAQAGARLIALNPLHALFPADRERASPYHPSDRRFLDPIYLDVPAAGPPADTGKSIAYRAVWAAKAEALANAAELATGEAFARFVADGGQALADFCAFQVISEAHPGDWRGWPAALRDPASPAVAAFVAARPERLAHHQALQWRCDRQFADAAARAPGLGFCRDLAVGAAPDGSEAWAAADRLAHGVSIGAPPDLLAPQGQVWGLPPPDPHRWRAEGYRSFSELLRANMRHAGALRIDHVLGLTRLFWVPEGADGADGAYVAYPQADLLSVLALESQAAECLVVGEDLGTVPDGLREALGAAGVYRYTVLPFERDGSAFTSPQRYPPRALACVSTHDIAPLAGWWEGADIDERRALGLFDEIATRAARLARAGDKTALLAAMAQDGFAAVWTAESPFSPELAAAIYAFAASGPSRIFMLQLEDLAGERVGVNLPGTDRERPNWRTRLGAGLDAAPQGALWRAITAAVRAERPPGGQ